MINSVVLVGRLTAAPELRYTTNGNAVATFTLAVDRNYTGQNDKETDFIRIVAWRKLAEVVANNLDKGRLVAVEGRIQVQQYQTDGGEKRQAFEVVANNVRFLDRPKE
jgi:single-strand DNA-binding protein